MCLCKKLFKKTLHKIFFKEAFEKINISIERIFGKNSSFFVVVDTDDNYDGGGVIFFSFEMTVSIGYIGFFSLYFLFTFEILFHCFKGKKFAQNAGFVMMIINETNKKY